VVHFKTAPWQNSLPWPPDWENTDLLHKLFFQLNLRLELVLDKKLGELNCQTKWWLCGSFFLNPNPVVNKVKAVVYILYELWRHHQCFELYFLNVMQARDECKPKDDGDDCDDLKEFNLESYDVDGMF